MVLLQPSLVLVDHGHFQYNSVCLGLAVAGASAVASGTRRGGERVKNWNFMSVNPAVIMAIFDANFCRTPSPL